MGYARIQLVSNMKEIIQQLEKRFFIKRKDETRHNLTFITVSKDVAVEVITYLRDYLGFRHLVMISAVDFIEDNLFQLTYLLHSYATHADIGVRVKLDRDHPRMESIHHLWAAASVYQRELYEMFGIEFPGSPHLTESMILEGWDTIPPMRKEFDTKKYAETTYFPREGRFKQDPREIMEIKLYPVETEVKYGIKQVVRKIRNR